MFGQVHIVTLPSGDKVRARKPSLITMFAKGIFPAAISDYAMMLYNRELSNPKKVIEDAPEPTLAQTQMFRLMDLFLPHVLVDPLIDTETKITLDDGGIQTGTVKLDDINDDDKNYLFLWGQGLLNDDAKQVLTSETATEKTPATADVAQFRPDEGAAPGPDGEAVQPAAVDVSGDRPVESARA